MEERKAGVEKPAEVEEQEEEKTVTSPRAVIGRRRCPFRAGHPHSAVKVRRQDDSPGGGARRGRASAAAAVPVSGRKLREFGCVVTLLLRSLIRLLSDPHWDYFLLLAAGRSSRIYGQNRFGPTAPRGPGE